LLRAAKPTGSIPERSTGGYAHNHNSPGRGYLKSRPGRRGYDDGLTSPTMVDILKLIGELLVGLFRSHVYREAESDSSVLS
jgi:hypothetical protein